MGTIITWLFGLGLIAFWSYLCVKIGLSMAAVQVNSMIREGKIIVHA